MAKKMKSLFPVLMARHNLERTERDETPLTLNALADEMEVSFTTLQRLNENTAKRCDFSTIAAVCGFFQCNVGDLLTLVDDDETPTAAA